MFWFPALLATLLFFGLPIHRARKVAERGLAGEERGELLVGAACGLVSAAVVGFVVFMRHRDSAHFHYAGHQMAFLVASGLAAIGGASGLFAALLALARDSRRRAFVARVSAGSEVGYRIDATPEGKALVRVTSQGEGYRVADFEERIADLDARGEITRAAR